MFFRLFTFECRYQLRKPATWAALAMFFLFGLFMGSLRYLPYPDLHRNAPYFLSYFTGLATLGTIFTITLAVAQSFLKDAETKMDSLVYAMPLRKSDYLFPPLAAVFALTFLALTIAILGLLLGNYLPWLPASERGAFSLSAYAWPLLVLAAPNILFCLSLTACIAWLSRKALSVYTGGLLLFILYLIGSVVSNSPLMAGASPATPEAMALTAKLDPFGLAAFFEQTRYWTVTDRNTRLLAPEGNFLINRLLWLAFSFLVLAFSYLKFSFRQIRPVAPEKKKYAEIQQPASVTYQPVAVASDSRWYHVRSMGTLVRMDLKAAVYGVPLLVMVLSWTALLAFEITNAIDGGVRMAALFATSSLMVSKTLETMPFMGCLILLFYSNELLWKVKSFNFLSIVTTTPVQNSSLYLAKLIVLSLIGTGLICWSILVGIGMQLRYEYPVIEFRVYALLFYYLGLPFLLLSVLLLFLQHLCPNKYLALGLSALVVVLVNSRFGLALGITHPLLRFANPIDLPYFEMNGFGEYATVFHWKMLQEGAMAFLLLLLTVLRWNRNKEPGFPGHGLHLNFSFAQKALLGSGLIMAVASGIYISYRTNKGNPELSGEELFDWRQNYEQTYKRFEKITQPEIVDVKTEIELYPARNAYRVKGTYKLVNKSEKNLDRLLLYFDPEIRITSISIKKAALILDDQLFRHSIYKLQKPLEPTDTLLLDFSFESSWSPFQAHNPTNTVLGNGTFIRMSRYFPKLGYQEANEIDNATIRASRKMPPAKPLKKVNAQENDPYQFINLEAIVSTDADQIALGSGNLIRSWKAKDRSYFHYKTDRPVPFRFAFSSARYQVKKAAWNNTAIEVYYDERHHRNVNQLIKNAKATLQYAETNFGPYPHQVIRFAEISSFAIGFAATAYPGIIYAKENQGFHADLRRSDEQDVINQLAGHELAHLWWGSAQVIPDIREGHSLMTETLAQYTELMLYRKAHGPKKSLDLVKVHLDLYLSGRGYQPEMPLYKADLESPYLVYNKGMVAMYQLEQLIGEQCLNKALKLFLKNHAFPNPAPRSTDLLRCLYKVSPAAARPKINELFKQVVTGDARIEHAVCKKLANGNYEVTFSGKVQKFRTDAIGRKHPLTADPLLEAGIETTGGTLKLATFPVRNGTVYGKIVVSSKPLTLTLDPHLKNLDPFPKDNTLAL
jgi:ABC-2 type transport system permease protein